MLISHSVDGGALHVPLHHSVDVNTRAAAAVEIDMCKNLDIPLNLSGATTAAQRLFTANTA
ncbi:hypothetical protein CG723_43910 [Streptomyces sp. CB01635]|uniref:hypothetical protein n=1 Tax=unclassified Streptomyces TaxID=2593676 RepID=UPI000C2724E2|nr:hypothetical protein [Streptomyces sp. CB01635]PJN05557.1 hypothetical protein CG723_43910 [Streptomyces sp. CB01635]